MEPAVRRVFLLLILAQAAHSIEECVTKLYAVFPPARFVASLVSANPGLGFAIANVLLVAFGLWCWIFPVRKSWHVGPALIWFWTILELANGISHSIFALLRGGYFPGVITAPLLLFFASWLVLLQTRQVRTAP